MKGNKPLQQLRLKSLRLDLIAFVARQFRMIDHGDFRLTSQPIGNFNTALPRKLSCNHSVRKPLATI
jgi:hypothetical protein